MTIPLDTLVIIVTLIAFILPAGIYIGRLAQRVENIERTVGLIRQKLLDEGRIKE